MRWPRRKPRWEVVVRSRRATTRPLRIRITKRDRVELEFPSARAIVTLARPRRRLQAVKPYDQLEVWHKGELLSSLPIRVLSYHASERHLIIRSERPREEPQCLHP